MSFFSFSRRLSPLSTASATAIACGRVKLTVALMLIPRQVASSIASMPARGGRDLHDHVWCKSCKALRLLHNGPGVAEQPGIRLDGKTSVPSLLTVEDRLEEPGCLDGHLFHDPPRNLAFGRAGHLLDERRNPVFPERPFLLQNSENDHRITGGAHGAVVLDGVPQLLQGAGIVPEHRGCRPCHNMQACLNRLVHGHLLTVRLSPG